MRSAPDDQFNLTPDLLQIDVKILQNIGAHTGPLADQPQQDMFGANMLVVKAQRLLVGQLHHFSSPDGKLRVHCRTILKMLVTLPQTHTETNMRIVPAPRPEAGYRVI